MDAGLNIPRWGLISGTRCPSTRNPARKSSAVITPPALARLMCSTAANRMRASIERHSWRRPVGSKSPVMREAFIRDTCALDATTTRRLTAPHIGSWEHEWAFREDHSSADRYRNQLSDGH